MSTHRRLVRLTLFFLLLVLIGAAIVGVRLYTLLPKPPQPNNNALALGDRAPAGDRIIPLNPPEEFDGLTRADIYAKRRAAVMQQPDLIGGEYVPADSVFGQIVDGLPWWGLPGQYYWASGENSPNGLSEEARFVLNPYLLAAAEFYGFSFYGKDDFSWDVERVEQARGSEADFLWMCASDTLRWQPRDSAASVDYDVTGCMDQLNRYVTTPLTLADASFLIEAYNARDFNLNYLALVSERTTGFEPFHTGVITNRYFLHQGNSCGYPGGCNNGSPLIAELDGLQISDLPARLTLHFWRDPPPAASAAPDFVYVMNFR